ncbi:MAG: hypothetical protein P4L51_15200 [Puia sp.]|nr:hypothetical protein [Puia sp.]
MKKARIMLSALAVVAVVGGALAFKAKTVSQFYCVDAVSGTCGTFYGTNGEANPTTAVAASLLYYTITTNITACPNAQCPSTQQERLTKE